MVDRIKASHACCGIGAHTCMCRRAHPTTNKNLINVFKSDFINTSVPTLPSPFYSTIDAIFILFVCPSLHPSTNALTTLANKLVFLTPSLDCKFYSGWKFVSFTRFHCSNTFHSAQLILGVFNVAVKAYPFISIV